jgi:hypothetical protein
MSGAQVIYPDGGFPDIGDFWVFLRFSGFLVVRVDILLDLGSLDIS